MAGNAHRVSDHLRSNIHMAVVWGRSSKRPALQQYGFTWISFRLLASHKITRRFPSDFLGA